MSAVSGDDFPVPEKSELLVVFSFFSFSTYIILIRKDLKTTYL